MQTSLSAMVQRTYKANFLAVLMTDGDKKTNLLIYGLSFTQHNTFILSKDLSDMYISPGEFSRIIFTGEEEKDVSTIGVMSI